MPVAEHSPYGSPIALMPLPCRSNLAPKYLVLVRCIDSAIVPEGCQVCESWAFPLWLLHTRVAEPEAAASAPGILARPQGRGILAAWGPCHPGLGWCLSLRPQIQSDAQGTARKKPKLRVRPDASDQHTTTANLARLAHFQLTSCPEKWYGRARNQPHETPFSRNGVARAAAVAKKWTEHDRIT